MISNEDVNILQKQKLDLQIQLNELLKSKSKNIDYINELKSEILYLNKLTDKILEINKQIEKIIGSNEIKRQNELKRKKLGIEETNINNYYSFKAKYKKICKMRISVFRMLNVIENYMNNNTKNIDEIVKVKA